MSRHLKLTRLRELLEELPAQKVAVFASFGDTIHYLDENLPGLVGGRIRVTVIGTRTDPDSRMEALARFCPRTVVRDDYDPPDGEVDLLLSTDILSEGQNLQQAASVVSYDMPWNPQRVVQRNGRVVRLKSPHAAVTLATMLPVDGELENFLKLEATIRRKVLAASLYGMETEVVDTLTDGAEDELRTFASRLVAGDDSLLTDDEDDVQAGGFTGETLRAQLLRAISEGELERIRGLPWGIGAAFRQGPGVPSKGAPGVFFACRTRDGQRYWRFVEADGGDVVTSEPEMLRRINPGDAEAEASPSLDLEGAWRQAVASILEERNRRADPRGGAQGVGPVQEFAIQLLRDPAIAMPTRAAAAEAALSVERSSTVRHALAEIGSAVRSNELARDEGAVAVMEVVEAYGLQPVAATVIPDPITEDDVGVVCWMAVLASHLVDEARMHRVHDRGAIPSVADIS